MSAANLILIGVAVVAIFSALGAFAIAFRRTRSDDDWQKQVQSETRAADRSTQGVRVEPLPQPEPEVAAEPEPVVDEPAEPVESEPASSSVSVVETQRVVEVSPEEAGVTRRQFFNRALGSTFGVWGAGLGLGVLAFLWPRVSGGFGADVNAGDVGAIEDQIVASDGSVVPLFIPEARAYVVPSPPEVSEQFEGRGVVEAGLVALYQRCVHLGCRVPWCTTSQGFECPCHGSKYNGVGEYFAGPAPRNLDRFVIEINDSNELVIRTGLIIETPRAPSPSVEYPRGPSCI